MLCHQLTVCTLVGIILAGFSGHATAAAAPSTKVRVAALLQIGWTRSIQARKDAQQQYDRLADKAAGDWRIPYAYALVQIQQYRYTDAAKLLDQVLKLDPKNVEANRLRIWIAVILKDYTKALGRMQELADALPTEPTDAAVDTANRELATLLGRMCGFMEGPVKSSVPQTARAACAERLDSQLTGARRAAFEKGRRAVLRQFEAIDEEHELTKTQEKETGEKIKERVVGELKQQAGDLAKQLDAEQARLSELRKTMGYELDQIKTDAESAGQRLRVQQSAAQQAGLRLRDVDARLAELYDLANREKDPNLRQQYLFDAAHWRGERDRWAAELNVRNQHLAAEVSKIRELEQRRATIEARWQRESGGAAKLEGSLKRTVRDQQRYEKKAVDTNTPQAANQQRHSVALSTYVPLPIVLEEEKERVLNLFEN
ncbi:MAG: hypothetical protein WCJ35_06795 [Planctomycetota bacterium]